MRRDGPRGLYWGFLPHCSEAWPNDVSELLVYGTMMDWREDAVASSGDAEGTKRRCSEGGGGEFSSRVQSAELAAGGRARRAAAAESWRRAAANERAGTSPSSSRQAAIPDSSQQGSNRQEGGLLAAARSVPEEAWTLAVGAAAGAVAAVVAMPFDCIKTHIQTHSAATLAPHCQISAAGGVAANLTAAAASSAQAMSLGGDLGAGAV